MSAREGRVLFAVPPLADSPSHASPRIPPPPASPENGGPEEPRERTLGAIGCTTRHLSWWRGRGQVHWVCAVCHPPVSEPAERRKGKMPPRMLVQEVSGE